MRLLFEGKVLNQLLHPEERNEKDEKDRLEILAKARKIAGNVIVKPESELKESKKDNT